MLAVHNEQITEHGGSYDVRDKGLLASALTRPKNIYHSREPKPSIAEVASYAYGITRNHAFIDGNKRTAFVICRLFLELNGLELKASDADKYRTFMQLASGELTEEELGSGPINFHFTFFADSSPHCFGGHRMSDQFWLTRAQLKRIERHFPLSHGIPRVDDLRVISGIIHVIRNGLRWCDAPKDYGPHKTLYNRFIRWSRMGVFDQIFASLAGEHDAPEQLMIDSTHLKAHRTAASLLKKGMFPAVSGAPRAG